MVIEVHEDQHARTSARASAERLIGSWGVVGVTPGEKTQVRAMTFGVVPHVETVSPRLLGPPRPGVP